MLPQVEADARAEGRRDRAVLLLGGAAEAGKPGLPEHLHRPQNGVPGIAVAGRPPGRSLAVAAYPDRWVGPLVRRDARHIVETDEVAVERYGPISGPERKDGGQRLVGEAATLRARHAQDAELVFGIPHADPQDEPAAAELIDVRREAGGEDRVAVGQDRDGGTEVDPLGVAGQPGERGEGVKERFGV